MEESSDDSDFRIEDHPEISDDDDSMDSNAEGESMSEEILGCYLSIWLILYFCIDAGSSDAEEEEDSDASDYGDFGDLNISKNGLSIAEVLEKAKSQSDGNLKVWFFLYS